MNKTSGTSAISIDKINLTYGNHLVLDDCTLQVKHGESVALLGPNGAGKTSLLEVIQGFRRPSTGRVEVLGTDPLRANYKWSSKVGIVLQGWRDHFFWSPRELIKLVELAHLNVGAGSKNNTANLISVLDLEPFMDQRIGRLSGGERRRLDVCLALLGEPEILFLDEPTSAFDPAVRREFHDFMESLKKTTTIIWATHDLTEAERNCERIVLMHDGRLAADATPDELRRSVQGGTTVEWTDEQGIRKNSTTDEPNTFLAELIAMPSVSDIRVNDTSFEDVYLELLNQVSGEEGQHP